MNEWTGSERAGIWSCLVPDGEDMDAWWLLCKVALGDTVKMGVLKLLMTKSYWPLDPIVWMPIFRSTYLTCFTKRKKH